MEDAVCPMEDLCMRRGSEAVVWGDTVKTYGLFSRDELGTISAEVTSTVSCLSIGLFPGRKRLEQHEN